MSPIVAGSLLKGAGIAGRRPLLHPAVVSSNGTRRLGPPLTLALTLAPSWPWPPPPGPEPLCGDEEIQETYSQQDIQRYQELQAAHAMTSWKLYAPDSGTQRIQDAKLLALLQKRDHLHWHQVCTLSILPSDFHCPGCNANNK